MSTAVEKQTTGSQPQRGSLLRTVKAVAWSFIGLRRKSDYQEDMAKLSPVHIIFVGLAGAVIFVAGLAVLVHWVVAK